MGRIVYLLRHADALGVGETPFGAEGPPLSDAGKEVAGRVGRWLKAQSIGIHSIVTSPLLRAVQTGGIVAVALGLHSVASDPRLDSGTSPGMIRELITSRPEKNILLCGHEPDMGKCLADLIGWSGGAIPFKKAALAAIVSEEDGSWRLQFFLSPAVLSLS